MQTLCLKNVIYLQRQTERIEKLVLDFLTELKNGRVLPLVVVSLYIPHPYMCSTFCSKFPSLFLLADKNKKWQT